MRLLPFYCYPVLCSCTGRYIRQKEACAKIQKSKYELRHKTRKYNLQNKSKFANVYNMWLIEYPRHVGFSV